MPRYVKQRDKYSCGPVAILNALRWAGVNADYGQSVKRFTATCKCAPPEGTAHREFDSALRKAGKRIFQVRRVHRPLLPQIEAHLQEGGVIVFNYYWRKKDEEHRHFILLAGISGSGRTFYTVNDFRKGRALRKYQRRYFKKWHLRFQSTDPHYKAWFVSRRD